MPLPVLEKSWQFNVNNFSPAPGSGSLANRTAFLNLKNALIGFASSPWTVSLSSNSVVAGAGDNWSTVASLVQAASGSPHSWIVLRQTGIATNYELCLDLNSATVSSGSIVVSPSAGFTGGSITNRPTATDEIVLINTGVILNNTANVGMRWSAMQSTDGACTALLVATGGNLILWSFLATPGDPLLAWSNPSHSWWFPGVGTTANFYAAAGNGRVRIGGFNGNIVPLVPGDAGGIAPNNTTWGNAANQVTNEWPIYPLGMACVTSPIRGFCGRFIDVWGGSAAVLVGDTYPGDGSKQFAQFGAFILPWNGGPVNLS